MESVKVKVIEAVGMKIEPGKKYIMNISVPEIYPKENIARYADEIRSAFKEKGIDEQIIVIFWKGNVKVSWAESNQNSNLEIKDNS